METRVLDGSIPLVARATRGRVGLIALATDHTSEVDTARILAPRGIGVYATRIPFANPVTPQNLAAMAGDITRAAALILPDEGLDALIYSCTSASVVIGDAAVQAAMLAGKPGTVPVTPISAGVAGLRAMGARRISLLTPYDGPTTEPMARCFEAAGFTLDAVTALGMTDDRAMARIAPDALVEAARAATAPGSDALFVSCTAVPAAAIIDRIEAAAGVPAVSSNLATAWYALRLCGDAGAAGPGHLMTLGLPG